MNSNSTNNQRSFVLQKKKTQQNLSEHKKKCCVCFLHQVKIQSRTAQNYQSAQNYPCVHFMQPAKILSLAFCVCNDFPLHSRRNSQCRNEEKSIRRWWCVFSIWFHFGRLSTPAEKRDEIARLFKHHQTYMNGSSGLNLCSYCSVCKRWTEQWGKAWRQQQIFFIIFPPSRESAAMEGGVSDVEQGKNLANWKI